MQRRAGQISVGSGRSPPSAGLRTLAVAVAALLLLWGPADQTMQGPRALLRGVAAAARAVGAQVKGRERRKTLGVEDRVPVRRAELVGRQTSNRWGQPCKRCSAQLQLLLLLFNLCPLAVNCREKERRGEDKEPRKLRGKSSIGCKRT